MRGSVRVPSSRWRWRPAFAACTALSLDVEGDALHLGRGARSGVGIGLFHRGGLVVDGGCKKSEAPAPIVSHIRFPDRWRIIVVLDPARRGLHGADEAAAFGKLPPFAENDAARLCRLVIMKMLPAAAEEDIVSLRRGDHGNSRMHR